MQIRVLDPLIGLRQPIIPKVITALWNRANPTADTWTLRDRVDEPTDYVRSWVASTNAEMFRFEMRIESGTITALVRAACADAVADIVDELEWWLSMWLGESTFLGESGTSVEIQRGDECWRATSLPNASPGVTSAYNHLSPAFIACAFNTPIASSLADMFSTTRRTAATPPALAYPLMPCAPQPAMPPTAVQLCFRKSGVFSVLALHMSWLRHPTFRDDAPVFTNARGRVYAGNVGVYTHTQLEQVAMLDGCPFAIVLMRAPSNPVASRFEATKVLAEWLCVDDAAFPDIVRSVRDVHWAHMLFVQIPDICARFTLVEHADLLPSVPRGVLASVHFRSVDLDPIFVHRYSIRDWILANQETAFDPMETPLSSASSFTWKQYGAATPAFVRAKNHWIIGDLVVMDEELALKMRDCTHILSELSHIIL